MQLIHYILDKYPLFDSFLEYEFLFEFDVNIGGCMISYSRVSFTVDFFTFSTQQRNADKVLFRCLSK